MPLNDLDLDLAWRRTVIDSKKQFVPDYLDLKDYKSNLDENLENLRSKLTIDFRPQVPFTIDQPKTNFSLRPGLVINIEDRIVYQALVDFISPIVDPNLSDHVYSHRLSSKRNDPYFFKNPIHQWKFFLEARRKCYVEDGYTHLLQTDISTFFEHISHKILIEKLEYYIEDAEVIKVLTNLLEYWSRYTGMQGMGLPQNSAPSSFLSNFYLISLDDKILREDNIGCEYLRFADDINIFTNSNSDAKKILKILVKNLRDLYLNIQDKKTKIFENTQIEKLIDEKQDIIAAIDYGIDDENLTIEPISLDKLINLFEETIQCPDDFGKQHFNACIARFKKIKNDYAIDYILDKLVEMPDFAKSFSQYLGVFIDNSNKIKNAIASFLANSEKNIYEWQEMWFLILLGNANNLNRNQLRVVGRISRNHGKHWAARAFAILALGKHGDESDRAFIKSEYIDEGNIYIKKAIVIACHKMNRPERNLFYDTVLRENDVELNRLIGYLKSVNSL